MRTNLLLNHQFDKEEDRKAILREYRALMRALKGKLKKGDKELIRDVFELAADAHKEMRRKSGEPYITHPLAVARITVEEIGLGVTSACCALLHDTVEDTEITLEDLEKKYGAQVSKIIDGLTKISKVVGSNNNLNSNNSLQAENFRKILVTLGEDPRVLLIKLADRLHNMRTLGSMKREKQLKIASETTFIFTPLAHRLGLYEIKTELEDLALKYTQPDIYREIVQKLNATKRGRNKFIKEFIAPIEAELDKTLIKYQIYGRAKSINSIYSKMKNKQVAFEEVFDLFAIRIIIDAPKDYKLEKETCWNAYSTVTNLYRPNPARLRDWISVPKGNGYEALHTTVMGPKGRWVEVQIRTKRMNEIAEMGLAAHWKYKEGDSHESKLDSFLKSIGELIKDPNVDNAKEFVQDIKTNFFTKEIYVYTPKGDMHILPKGATALDFAFEIHSELGTRCIGAKVNYKLVPLSYQLKSGDQVEVITSLKQRPSEDWLKFVITAKAITKIKHSLKEEKRRVAAEGHTFLVKILKKKGLATHNQNINEIIQFFKSPSPLDLYYSIATNVITLEDLDKLHTKGDKVIPPPRVAKKQSSTVDDSTPYTSKSGELVISGNSSNDIEYRLATCCQPIPGDSVFGYISSDGLKIHRTNCTNAQSLLANHGDRIIKTKWAINSEISFLAGVKIKGIDDIGIVRDITSVLSGELNINMRSVSFETIDGIFEGKLMLYVHDLEELERLFDKIKAIKGIYKVERTSQEKVSEP